MKMVNILLLLSTELYFPIASMQLNYLEGGYVLLHDFSLESTVYEMLTALLGCILAEYFLSIVRM